PVRASLSLDTCSSTCASSAYEYEYEYEQTDEFKDYRRKRLAIEAKNSQLKNPQGLVCELNAKRKIRQACPDGHACFLS
ncbi:hypothetical protein ACW7EJ_02730, partial [Acinetobacter soli]